MGQIYQNRRRESLTAVPAAPSYGGLYARTGGEADGGTYAGPAPLSASAVSASAGPIQASGKSLDDADREQLALNDAAGDESLVTSANLPSKFHFIKRRRALDRLRQQRAARLAAGSKPAAADPAQVELPPLFAPLPDPAPLSDPEETSEEDSYGAVNSQGPVELSPEQQASMQEAIGEAKQVAAENWQNAQDMGFDENTPIGTGVGGLEQQREAQNPYSGINIDGTLMRTEKEKEELQENKEEAMEAAAKDLEELQDEGLDITAPLGGGGGTLRQQMEAQNPYSASDQSGPVVESEAKKEKHRRHKKKGQKKAAKALKAVQELGFDTSTPIGAGNGLTLEEQQRAANRERKETEDREARQSIFDEEKARLGYKPGESYTGIEEYDSYLAAALPFYDKKKRGEIMMAFHQGNQKPEVLGLLIRQDMKRVSETMGKKNRTKLLSQDRDTALDARAGLMGSQVLANSINKLLQKSKLWSSFKDISDDGPKADLAQYLKPEGKFAEIFQRRKGKFDAAMARAESLRRNRG